MRARNKREWQHSAGAHHTQPPQGTQGHFQSLCIIKHRKLDAEREYPSNHTRLAAAAPNATHACTTAHHSERTGGGGWPRVGLGSACATRTSHHQTDAGDPKPESISGPLSEVCAWPSLGVLRGIGQHAPPRPIVKRSPQVSPAVFESLLGP